MMDHALRTVCFICDMGNVLVLMARRLTSDSATDFNIEEGKPVTLGSIAGEREKKTSKNICHVFEAEIEVWTKLLCNIKCLNGQILYECQTVRYCRDIM